MNDEDVQLGGDRFPPTRRSVIEAVSSRDAEDRELALESLCRAYWKPTYNTSGCARTGPQRKLRT